MSKKYLCCLPAIFFIIASFWYNYYTPFFTPPDEERHFTYAEFIALNKSLPPYRYSPEGTGIHMAYHPPLYYLISSLLFHENQPLLKDEITVRDAPGHILFALPDIQDAHPAAGIARTVQRLRVLSLILGIITTVLIYAIALRFFKEHLPALATTVFAVSIPQFLHLSTSVSNENLSTMLSTAYLLALLYLYKQPNRLKWQLFAGILLGLCLLSKTSSIFYFPVTALFMFYLWLRKNIRTFDPCIVIFITALAVSGWWFLRNWMQFNDPMLSNTYESLNTFHLRNAPLSPDYIKMVLGNTFTTFFGVFGALDFSLPDSYFIIYRTIIAISTVGLCMLPFQRALTSDQFDMFVLMLLVITGGAGIYACLNIKYTGFYMGRLLYLIIAPLALITLAGFLSLMSPRWKKPALAALSLLCITITLQVPWHTLKPAFANPRIVSGADQFSFGCYQPLRTVIGQTFTSPCNNLCAVRILVSCPPRLTEGELLFTISENGYQGKNIHQLAIPVSSIHGISRCYFVFPPIQDSMHKRYHISLHHRALSEENLLTVGYDLHDSYKEGTMLINGVSVTGDIYFTTYCFTGEHPDTDWEGRRTLIIPRMYVSLRELQLYSEMSKEQREKSFIHKKLQQAAQAFSAQIRD